MINFIKKYHYQVLDSHGCPYWTHPYRVALLAVKIANETGILVNSDELFQTALLHDVFEDTYYSDEVVLADGFLSEAIVHAHSLDKANYVAETYNGKIQELIDRGELIPIVVKLADNLDNSQFWRAKEIGKPTTKYEKSMVMLADYLGITIKEEWR